MRGWRLFFGLGLSVLLSPVGWTQQRDFNFLPSFEAEAPPPLIGGKGKFSVGVYSETFIPFNTPFGTETLAVQDMRYQVPVAFGAEVAFGISNSFEIAVAGGYEHFETQQFTGIQSTRGSTVSRQFDRVNYTFFPVMALVRYRWGRKSWSPEVELGAGAAFGRIKTRSTVLNSEQLEKGGPFYKGHASFGYAFSWADNYSLHMHLGYAGNYLGSDSYVTADYTITQKSFHHGVFFRGWARYEF